MVEAISEPPHLAIQLFFPGMGERGVSDVVGEGERFRQIVVEPQRSRNRARNLDYFDGVG